MSRCRNRRPSQRRVALLAAAAVALYGPLSVPGGLAYANVGGGVRIAELTGRAESAINNALKYLAGAQAEDGGWDHNARYASTALALMAFMLQGHFPKYGKYAQTTDKALAFLLKRSRSGAGYFGGNMYQHALATLALSEIWGMSDRDEIRDALKKAVTIILRSQGRQGGWRYHPVPADADLSVTVMQIVALHSAKEAGMYVPQKTIDRATAYVMSCQKTFTSGFGYVTGGRPGFATTGAGLTSLLMCGMDPRSRPIQSGLAYLFKYPRRKFTDTPYYFYAHYYAIQAVYQAGESYYQKWYPNIHDALVKRQKFNGSWPGSQGLAYGTSLAVLILGVPYRFLPVYQR